MACQEERKRLPLEEAYPDICQVVTNVRSKGGCQEVRKIDWYFSHDLNCMQETDMEDEWRKVLDSEAEKEKTMKLLTVYTRDNMVMLNIYINKKFAEKWVIDEVMSMSEFQGNLGGLLGGSVGASMVSIAELVWHIVTSWWK